MRTYLGAPSCPMTSSGSDFRLRVAAKSLTDLQIVSAAPAPPSPAAAAIVVAPAPTPISDPSIITVGGNGSPRLAGSDYPAIGKIGKKAARKEKDKAAAAAKQAASQQGKFNRGGKGGGGSGRRQERDVSTFGEDLVQGGQLPDFDFAANLQKFDKSKVFAEFDQEGERV